MAFINPTQVNLGNYFQNDDRSQLIQNQATLSPAVLSKIIRSGTNQKDILEAIEKTDNLTQENLCDALDRELDLLIFKALVDKIQEINESVLTCAIYQDRIEEIQVILASGKSATVDPEKLLEKAKTGKMRDFLTSFYPELKTRNPAPINSVLTSQYMVQYDDSLSSAELQILQFKEASSSLSAKAICAANERNFQLARLSWDAIPDEQSRIKVASELFEICFEIGDREALECLIHIAKMEKDPLKRNSSLCRLIDACQQLQGDKEGLRKDISTLAMSEITDFYLARQYRKKLGLEFI